MYLVGSVQFVSVYIFFCLIIQQNLRAHIELMCAYKYLIVEKYKYKKKNKNVLFNKIE